MAFLSELIGRPVTDVDGKQVGQLKDLVARPWAQGIHPAIQAVVINRNGNDLILPFSSLAVLIAPAIPLKQQLDEVDPYTPKEEDIFLMRDVMDKQIIDTDGARVVRVNDLELVRVNDNVLVSNVDIGALGVLRRIGVAGFAQGFARKLNLRMPQTYVSWDDMELLRHDQSMRLRVPVNKLAELHPADIAEIISDMNRVESSQFLENLNIEQLADALEEVEPEFQASLVENMPDEKVADVLEEMDPDEAADLLAELPRERSQDLLELMEKDEAEDVRRLLAYPEDSAGGIMTTEYAKVLSGLTVNQAIQILRETGEEAETLFYIYVTGENNRLEGVISLKNLIFERPETTVDTFMQRRLVTVHPLDKQDQVAQAIAKYDLLAIPVVDEDNILQGIVTADDALDKIIPTAWKKRLPRFYR